MEFGELKVHRVYEFYDGNRLFSATDPDGKFLLFLWSDELPHSEVWLVLSLSAEGLRCMEAGEVDLNEAFTEPESGTVFRLFVAENGHCAVSTMRDLTVDSEEIPRPGVFLMEPMRQQDEH
jgi:hypothetical protein